MIINKILSKINGLKYRLDLINECKRLKQSGKHLPKDLKKMIFKSPSTYEDFINILCFIDNKHETNLIDIGANVGKFTSDFIKFFPNTNQILLFEPNLELNNKIKDNLNEFKNFEIINKGVGEKNETKIFNYNNNETALGSFKEYNDIVKPFYKNENLELKNIEIIKLDDFINFSEAQKQIVVKIDVQGFESQVIKGGLKFLEKSDLIILECSFVSEYKNTEPSFIECAELLKKINIYPIIFQDYGKKISNYAFERDVIFVKKELLNKIFYSEY